MRRKKKIRGIPDPHTFKYLNKSINMNIKQEHRSMIGKFIIEQVYKIAKGKDDKTFAEVYDLLNEAIKQIQKLQQTYDR